jgi:hypothetical protein
MAIALAVTLAVSALTGPDHPAPAALTPIVATAATPRTPAPADRACARVVARRFATRAHSSAAARRDERTCERRLATSTEPGFFLASTPSAASSRADR